VKPTYFQLRRFLLSIGTYFGPELLARYVVVGIVNTAMGNFIFWIIWNLCGEKLGLFPSSVTSFFLSVLFSFFTQSHLVFQVIDNRLHRLGRFFFAQSFNLFLFLTSIFVLSDLYGWGPYASYFLGSVIVIAVGLVINGRWVFQRIEK